MAWCGPSTCAAHLGDPRAALHDPRQLPDAAALEARIARARADHERVLVLGDFDADGLTGLAILVTALRRLGLDVGWHVPAREAEGHGLSVAAIDRATAESRTLIITVDTGSSSVAEVALAASRGIDVIVTDHHHVPPVPPAAVALVNPHRRDSVYPDARLAGSGVAFKVAQLLLAGEPGRPGRRRSTWPTWPSSARSPTWRPSSARTSPSPVWGWPGCARRPVPVSPPCWLRPAWRRSAWTWSASASPWRRA